MQELWQRQGSACLDLFGSLWGFTKCRRWPFEALPLRHMPGGLPLDASRVVREARCEVVYPSGEAALADLKLTMSMHEVKAPPNATVYRIDGYRL